MAHTSYAELIAAIRQRVDQIATLDSRQFAQATVELRDRVGVGEPTTSNNVVCESFALTAEAVRRVTGMTYFDVQLVGGLVLAAGAIAEIQTGEGKTIITALPTVLHALCGRGVHVATTNEYLSRRDYEELREVYELLGLSSGLLEPKASSEQKLQAYTCDITYGPGYEFGFDFLRDQLTLRSRYVEPLGARHLQRLRGQLLADGKLIQRGHAFAIIDEADSG